MDSVPGLPLRHIWKDQTTGMPVLAKRRPSDLAAQLSENSTMDDKRKEVLLQQMPRELTLHIASHIKKTSLQETRHICDEFFDQNGKLINTTTATNVNHVTSSLSRTTTTTTTTTTVFYNDLLHIPVRGGRVRTGSQRRPLQRRTASKLQRLQQVVVDNNNNNSSRSNYQSSSSQRPGGASGSSFSSSSNPPANTRVCKYHIKWGDQAERCEGSWCVLKHKVFAPKGQASR